jgi:hypothetical protein
LADAAPRSEVLGIAVVVAGALLALAALIASPLLDFMLGALGDGVASILASCMVLLFVPLTLLSFF